MRKTVFSIFLFFTVFSSFIYAHFDYASTRSSHIIKLQSLTHYDNVNSFNTEQNADNYVYSEIDHLNINDSETVPKELKKIDRIADLITEIVEIIGTAAFAICGAIICINRQLDLFGVIFLSLVTALGGGTTRDIIIGRTPPGNFYNYRCIFLSIVCSCLVFIFGYYCKKKYVKYIDTIEKINDFFDAIGLGSFCSVGCVVAISFFEQNGIENNPFLIIFCGVCTATGGGIIRDTLSSYTSKCFSAGFYLTPCLIGSTIFYYGRYVVGDSVSSIVVLVLVTVLRMLGYIYEWRLPKVDLSDKESEAKLAELAPQISDIPMPIEVKNELQTSRSNLALINNKLEQLIQDHMPPTIPEENSGDLDYSDSRQSNLFINDRDTTLNSEYLQSLIKPSDTHPHTQINIGTSTPKLLASTPNVATNKMNTDIISNLNAIEQVLSSTPTVGPHTASLYNMGGYTPSLRAISDEPNYDNEDAGSHYIPDLYTASKFNSTLNGTLNSNPRTDTDSNRGFNGVNGGFNGNIPNRGDRDSHDIEMEQFTLNTPVFRPRAYSKPAVLTVYNAHLHDQNDLNPDGDPNNTINSSASGFTIRKMSSNIPSNRSAQTTAHNTPLYTHNNPHHNPIYRQDSSLSSLRLSNDSFQSQHPRDFDPQSNRNIRNPTSGSGLGSSLFKARNRSVPRRQLDGDEGDTQLDSRVVGVGDDGDDGGGGDDRTSGVYNGVYSGFMNMNNLNVNSNMSQFSGFNSSNNSAYHSTYNSPIHKPVKRSQNVKTPDKPDEKVLDHDKHSYNRGRDRNRDNDQESGDGQDGQDANIKYNLHLNANNVSVGGDGDGDNDDGHSNFPNDSHANGDIMTMASNRTCDVLNLEELDDMHNLGLGYSNTQSKPTPTQTPRNKLNLSVTGLPGEISTKGNRSSRTQSTTTRSSTTSSRGRSSTRFNRTQSTFIPSASSSTIKSPSTPQLPSRNLNSNNSPNPNPPSNSGISSKGTRSQRVSSMGSDLSSRGLRSGHLHSRGSSQGRGGYTNSPSLHSKGWNGNRMPPISEHNASSRTNTINNNTPTLTSMHPKLNIANPNLTINNSGSPDIGIIEKNTMLNSDALPPLYLESPPLTHTLEHTTPPLVSLNQSQTSPNNAALPPLPPLQINQSTPRKQ